MINKKISLFVIFSIMSLITHACDICGLGAGNSYTGILPDFHKKIFGIRNRYNAISSHLGVNGANTYLTTKERYQTLEAWGGWNIGRKLRILGSIPYSFNRKENSTSKMNKNGIGDISVVGYYQILYNKRPIAKHRNYLSHTLWIGTGIKLATGSYNSLDNNTTDNSANLFQLGTGSNDFSVGAMYDIGTKNIGINFNTNYKINTTNKYQYQYGNKFNINTQLYYRFAAPQKVSLAPNVGVQYEYSEKDSQEGYKVTASGGKLLLGTAGLELSLYKIALGANIQIPLRQNLASGIIKAENRLMMHLSIAL